MSELQTGRGELPERAVIEDTEDFPYDQQKVSRQWELLSGLVLRELKTDPTIREELLRIVDQPLSETLGKSFFDVLQGSSNETVARLAERYTDDALGSMLDLPEVPDALIAPDLVNAPSLIPAGVSRWHPEGLPGLTRSERRLIADRYFVARGVKRLLLGAELREYPEMELDATGRLELPSGVQITANPGKLETVRALTDPELWGRAEQLKDRVYRIEVDGVSYILKERKTNKHLHVKQGGHTDGLTSQEEFAAARYFEQLGTIEDKDISVRWEKPVGCVVFPDGYSFTVFEQESNLWVIGEHHAQSDQVDQVYAEEIEKHPEHYQREFMLYKGLAEVIQESPEIFGFTLDRTQRRVKTPLDFRSFARVKARFDRRRSELIFQTTVESNGFYNSDHDGYGYRIHMSDDAHRAALEMVGFDFEYYRFNVPSTDKKKREELNARHFVTEEIGDLHSAETKEWPDHTPMTVMEALLYVSMLAKEFPDVFDKGVEVHNQFSGLGRRTFSSHLVR